MTGNVAGTCKWQSEGHMCWLHNYHAAQLLLLMCRPPIIWARWMRSIIQNGSAKKNVARTFPIPEVDLIQVAVS